MEKDKIMMDKWTCFLNQLDSNIEFDKELREYLEAIKDISEVRADEMDQMDRRREINEKLAAIVKFVDKYGKQYYEIGRIEGFKKAGDISGRDYYYYIADQKMKASVYYIRYLNFLDHIPGDNRETDLSKEQALTDMVREHLLKLKDINYIKYMMFNNMMREIRYVGAAYQYLWYWESERKNLFRADDGRHSLSAGKKMTEKGMTKEKFFSEMFRDVIGHMNGSDERLFSYSRDPFIVIAKYLRIGVDKAYYDYTPITSEQGISIKMGGLNNKSQTKFEIVKSVRTNSVKRGNEVRDFYGFIQDGKELGDSEELAYAVDPFPYLPDADINDKGTVVKIKSLLKAYLSTWSPGASDLDLQYYVADDKEVVTYGKIESPEYDVCTKGAPENQRYVEECKYVMELGKEEIIYLLLSIKKADTASLKNKYSLLKNASITDGFEYKIWEILKKGNGQEVIVDGRVEVASANKDRRIPARYLPLKITISADYVNKISVSNGKERMPKEIAEDLRGEIEKKVRAFLQKRYETIITAGKRGGYTAADFILTFIRENEYRCPWYIDKYQEFERAGKDVEISLLQHCIFKE